uniref:Insulin-like growth factor-binding protein 1 n=1 Tax=Cyprinus carpio carpio TaxID=630221 RepID=A0A8C1CC09_CYPCA
MNRLLLNFFWAAAFSALLSAPGLRASPVVGQEPIRCAPCSPERLAECPAVDASCEEVLKETGCGCCLACALKRGDSCGIYTAPCGSGLRCLPKPGEARPLHALTRGHGVCTETPEPDQNQSDNTPDLPESHNGPTALNEGGSTVFVPGHGKPFDPRVITAKESMKAKGNAIRKKLVELGPCHIELQTALEKITKSQQKLGDKMTRFYLPNCDKHGHYKVKQVRRRVLCASICYRNHLTS